MSHTLSTGYPSNLGDSQNISASHASIEADSRNLTVEGVIRKFGSVLALDRIELTVQVGELLTILGPSGSGKTTLLKIIAGFEYPDDGVVLLGDQDITNIPPAKRDIGMVFQNYALFPHMTVAENIAFPLQMRKVSKGECRERVENALNVIDMAGYGDRLPKQLSGGQQQRVALARAVVFRPKLLLLDEPFGALDRKLREQMQLEVCRLQRRLGLTAIFVTHDQEEALVMSDRIAVMNTGRIAQIGTPEEIYRKPVNRFVAGFIGESNLFHAQWRGDGCATIAGGISVKLPSGQVTNGPNIGVLLRPELAKRVGGDEVADTTMTGNVQEVIFLGDSVKYRVELDAGMEVIVRWPFHASGAGLRPNDRITIGWDREDVHVIEWE